MIEIRQLERSHIPAVLRVQGECYRPELIESSDCFLAKLAVYPAGCTGAWSGNLLVAYLFGHPWRKGQLVDLGSEFSPLPANADCMYLHDLAVMPAFRGQSIPRQLLGAVIGDALKMGLNHFALVAVQHSEGFWSRWGFEVRRTLPYAPGVMGSYMTCEGVPTWR